MTTINNHNNHNNHNHLINVLFIEFHNKKVGVSRQKDVKLLKLIKSRGIKVIEETHVDAGNTLGNWFYHLDQLGQC